MQYHKQLFKHDPDNGVYGDCCRTTLACLLDLKPEEVPYYYGEDQNAYYRKWLADKGLTTIEIPYPGDLSLDKVLTTVGLTNPDINYMLSGNSKNNVGHFVICNKNEIIHDTSLDDSGIAGPMEDGMYWVSFIGKLV